MTIFESHGRVSSIGTTNWSFCSAERLGLGGVGVRGVLLRGQRPSERSDPKDGGYNAVEEHL